MYFLNSSQSISIVKLFLSVYFYSEIFPIYFYCKNTFQWIITVKPFTIVNHTSPFKPLILLLAFHIALIPFRKVYIQPSPTPSINSRANWLFNLSMVTSLIEEKLSSNLLNSVRNFLSCVTSCSCGGVGKHTHTHTHTHTHIYIYIYMCVCVCVCV